MWLKERLQSFPLGRLLWRLLGEKQTALWSYRFWRNYFSKPKNDITLLLLTRQHLEMQKLKFSPNALFVMKLTAFVLASFFMVSSIFFIQYLIQLPRQAIIEMENKTLRSELDKMQFYLDTLQSSIDRMSRFDQKLRAMTEVDRQFAKLRGPKGQGGADETEPESTLLLGDQVVDLTELTQDSASDKYLDRRESFLVQRVYSWMRTLFKDSNLQEQSIEELFEVLKGREIQLAATPLLISVNGWVTSHFGYRLDPFNDRRTFHRGLDVAAREGAPIIAPADGVVTFAGSNGGFGKLVMLFHGYGMSTLYGHTRDIYVKEGQKVSRGDLIASVGNSGRSTAAHLHYEVIFHGVHVDPRKFILDRSL